MPELPEVETTCRGIAPHIVGASIDHVVIRDARLRWPIADDLAASLIGQRISGVERRAKYLIISCDNGFVLAHLGMTGSLRITSAEEQVKTHDHWDFLLSGESFYGITIPDDLGHCIISLARSYNIRS